MNTLQPGAAGNAYDLTPPTWELLICTIPHRHGQLLELLADLDRQISETRSGRVGALLYRDNLTATYGSKTQTLLEAATGDYVSCMDDDDLLLPGAVGRVLAALDQHPDYVGFKVRWTRDGLDQHPVEHSLRHPRWDDLGDKRLVRGIMHFNPIRRDLALLGTWEGGNEAEKRWGERVTLTGQCKTEVFLEDPVYWYRENTHDTFNIVRERLPQSQILPLPAFPWLTILETEHSV